FDPHAQWRVPFNLKLKQLILPYLPALLRTAEHSLSVSALVDSGSSGNFISQECLNQLHLSRQRYFQEYAVKTIQGKPLGRGRIRHSLPYITLRVGLFHSEKIWFLVLEDSIVSIILGHPWLHQHLPELRWDPCDITHWRDRCYKQCLSNIPRPPPVPNHLSSTQVESHEPEIPPEIPAEYMAFQDMFSKQAATHLPPHRPWDCAIELLPGAQLPKGKDLSSVHRGAPGDGGVHSGSPETRLYPIIHLAGHFELLLRGQEGWRFLSLHRLPSAQFTDHPTTPPSPPVPAALEELREAWVFTKLDLRSAYNLVRIREGDEWKTAFITPTGHCEYRVMPYGLSISPSIFQTFMNEVFREFLHRFVVVYIDYILIYSRNQAEHRQHVQQVLQKLRDPSLFLKLEKCEFHQPSVQLLGYNISAEGVQMDQCKVNAIQKWPQPSCVKELQRFLGFTNFYRRFIKDYSSITAPLTSLLRGKPRHLTWNPAAHGAFQWLKTIFSTAPLLHHPDPERPFTIEVDASTVGVGAVLSQAACESSPLHP
ncbi:hypothetical protein M9458_032597, partial [Cirrhinus mrigala]